MAVKKALITGITGQDGTYLAELLLQKGYEVHGIKRRASSFNTTRIDHLIEQEEQYNHDTFFLHYGDVTDTTNLVRLIHTIQPDEIYNLAAQSHVAVSFETPEYTAQADALGALRILEAIRILGLTQKTKFYQASTSELFGLSSEIPQRETTPFYPRSPYAAAKAYAYWITVNYRQAYNMFACNGILFNHESPLRGETFITRKITRAVARIVYGIQSVLVVGNLDARRHWGYAKDYVDAMWRMLQQAEPHDLVIATGVSHSVRDFIQAAFAVVNIPIAWQGSGLQEQAIRLDTGKVVVTIDPRYLRPTEVPELRGDASKARAALGWQPSVDFKTLVRLMVEADCALVQQQLQGTVFLDTSTSRYCTEKPW